MYFYKKSSIGIVKGNPNNIKITEPGDLITGEVIYKEYINGRR